MTAGVLITDHVFADLDASLDAIRAAGGTPVVAERTDEAALIEAAGDAEAILVCYAEITEPIVEAAAMAGCKVISRSGIGTDNIDVRAATEHGIVVTYVPDYCLDEVADHTMALLLAGARGIVVALDKIRDGGWERPARVHRLQGKRLAVIGAGAIGRRVMDRALGFGLEPIAYDPALGDLGPRVRCASTPEEAVAEADFVTLHAPATPATRHLVDADLIAAMRRSPLLVNTARGPLVDLDAALAALDSGALSGVALDVTEVEPPPADHPLRSHPRAILTPHMAFYSVEAEAELQRRATEEVVRALTGEPPDRPVNPEALDRGLTGTRGSG